MLVSGQASRQAAAMLRALILAALGLALLAAQAPQPKAETQQKHPAAEQPPPAPAGPLPVVVVNQPSSPAGYQNPCKGAQSDQRSDLCAQWTAANGARDAAYYARLQLGAAIVGMIGLIITIILTYQAVRAAQRSVAHAEKVAKLELRPWLSFSNLVVHRIEMSNYEESWIIAPVIEAQIINDGSNPATDIRVIAHAVDNPISKESEAEVEGWAAHQVASNRGFPLGILPPKGTGTYKYALPVVVPAVDAKGDKRRDVWPAVALAVIYRAVGDETIRQTVQMFSLSYESPEKPTESPQPIGFWLAETIYPDRTITIIAGSKLDRAT